MKLTHELIALVILCPEHFGDCSNGECGSPLI